MTTKRSGVERHEGDAAAERFATAMRAIVSVPSDRAAEIRAEVKPGRRERPASPSTRRTSRDGRRSESGRDGTDQSPSPRAR